MPKPRTEASDPDLYKTIQRFGQQIAALTDAIERLCDELQWRNNERRKDGERSPPPFVLHSMPLDPTIPPRMMPILVSMSVTTDIIAF